MVRGSIKTKGAELLSSNFLFRMCSFNSRMYKTIVGNLHNNSKVRLVWYLLDDQAELNFSFFPPNFRYQKKHLT